MRQAWTAAFAAGLMLCAGPAPAKTLVFCSEGNPESLNPQIVTTTTGMDAGRPIFNNLVEFAPGTTTIVPGLAESWTVSEDGSEYTFRLRSGVKFHANAVFRPSRELNADDVLFSLLRQWKEDHPYHRVSGATFDYFMDMQMPELLQSIDKLDERTVRIRLTRPEAPFLADLAMPFNAILSAEYADLLLRAGTPERLDREPVGVAPEGHPGSAGASNTSSITRTTRGGERTKSSPAIRSTAARNFDSSTGCMTITSRASSPRPFWTTDLIETPCRPRISATWASTPGRSATSRYR